MSIYAKEEGIKSKVRDHYDIFGKYRGAAHTSWNLNVKLSFWSNKPLVLHYMTNHDSQIFIQEVINRKDPNVDFKVIPENGKKFISIIHGRLKFFDSLEFMTMSLDSIDKSNGFGWF